MTSCELPDDAAGTVSKVLGNRLARIRFATKPIGERFEVPAYRLGSTTVDGNDVMPVKCAWVRRTWNANDAVVHLGAPADAPDLADLGLRVERMLAEALGYTWFIAPVMLHLVWSGHGLLDRSKTIRGGLDNADFQSGGYGMKINTNPADNRSNLLSVTLVDLVAKRLVHAANERLTRTKPIVAAIRESLSPLVQSDS